LNILPYNKSYEKSQAEHGESVKTEKSSFSQRKNIQIKSAYQGRGNSEIALFGKKAD
jgi:hypothetical protein